MALNEGIRDPKPRVSNIKGANLKSLSSEIESTRATKRLRFAVQGVQNDYIGLIGLYRECVRIVFKGFRFEFRDM